MKRSNNTFYSKVHSLSPEQLQALADGLYAQMTQELAAGGIEVVPADQVANHAALADLHKVARKSPSIVNDSSIKKISTLVGAKGLPIVLLQLVDQKVPKYYTEVPEGTYSNQLLGWDRQSREWLRESDVFNALSIVTAQQKLADDMKATTLAVRLTIPLIDMGSERVGFSGDRGKVKPNPRLVEAGTVFSFAGPGGNAGHMTQQVLVLQKPVAIQGVKFEVEAGAPRDGGGLIGALFGAAGVNADKADFVVKVDAAELQAGATAAGGALFKELAQTLAAAK